MPQAYARSRLKVGCPRIGWSSALGSPVSTPSGRSDNMPTPQQVQPAESQEAHPPARVGSCTSPSAKRACWRAASKAAALPTPATSAAIRRVSGSAHQKQRIAAPAQNPETTATVIKCFNMATSSSSSYRTIRPTISLRRGPCTVLFEFRRVVAQSFDCGETWAPDYLAEAHPCPAGAPRQPRQPRSPSAQVTLVT